MFFNAGKPCIHFCALAVLGLMVTAARADAMIYTPAEETVRKRMQDSNAFDEADQFCLGKKQYDSCAMPEALIDGGEGVCARRPAFEYRQDLSPSREFIPVQLFCLGRGFRIVDNPFKAEDIRRLQDEGIDTVERPRGEAPRYLKKGFAVVLSDIGTVDYKLVAACEDKIAKAEQEEKKNLSVAALCPEISTPVVDAYCQNKKEGDACTVAAQTRTGTRPYPGRCKNQPLELQRPKWTGGQAYPIRNELRCVPQTVERHFKKAATQEKLKQMFR